MNRLIALPAVLCIVLAGVLGAWGWSGREESRERAASEDLRRDLEEDLFGPPVSGELPYDTDMLRVQACSTLLRAASLDRTVGAGVPGLVDPSEDPGLTTQPMDPTVTLPAPEAARALINMLDPFVVLGLPDLDTPPVLEAMTHLRDQLQAAVSAGLDPFTSPVVQAAAQDLGAVVFPFC